MSYSLPYLAMFVALCVACGVDTYAVIVGLSFINFVNPVAVPPQLDFLLAPEVMWIGAGLYVIDFGIDKIPWVNSLWDLAHTAIGIPATAYIAVHAVGGDDPAQSVLIGLFAAVIGGAAHLTVAAIRLILNQFPGAVNLIASFAEDLAVALIVYTAWEFPLAFLVLVTAWFFSLIRLVPFLWRNVKEALSCCGTGSERIPIADLLRT